MLSMLLSVCASAEKIDSDYDLLYNLDIVSDSYENYVAKKTISQKEFLGALVGIVTDEKVAEADILNYALSNNIISSIDSKEIETAISYERALSLTLNALGYAKVIEYAGHDTSTVMKYAVENELTKGIALVPGDYLDGSSMLTLLGNALEANVLNVVLSNENGVYEKSDKNPLEAYRNVVEITGQITHTADTSLYDENGAGKGKIGIDDQIYEIGYTYSEELLGQTVYAYVQDETVLHVEPKNKDIRKIEIKGRDILSISDDFTQVEYIEDEKREDIELNPALTVIYNGKNYEGYTKEDLIPSSGKIVCIDNDRDKAYDIVFVYSYETMVVKSVSSVYKKIGNVYDIPDVTKTLDLSDEFMDVRIYSDGKAATFADIAVNNILSIAYSKSTEPMITIYIGKEKVNGIVSRLDEEEGTVLVGETEYDVNDTYIAAANAEGSKIDKLALRKAYDFYLDAFGEVAYVKSDILDGFEYAYFLKQRVEDDIIKVRLLNMNDEWEYVDYAEKVKLNEQNKKFAEEIYDQLGGKEMTPQLVLIKKDADGKIATIKQPELSNEYNPNKFTKTSEFERYYWTGDSSFNCRHYLKYDAIIILKPNSNDNIYDEEQYEVANVGYFNDWKVYKYIAYNVDEFGYPSVLEVKDTYGTSSATMYVNEVEERLDQYGDPAKYIVGNISGIENLGLYTLSGVTVADVEPGDIINVKLRKGKIIDLTVSYSAGDSRGYACPADNSQVHNGGTKVMGDVLSVDSERSMLLVDCRSEVLPIYIQSNAEIEIYDEEEMKYVVGTVSDIYEGNYVRMEMGNNQINTVIVFH